VALQFFTDLAYGNRPPTLEFNGGKFKTNYYDVAALVKEYVEKDSINELVLYFRNSSNEVSLILDSLNIYQRKAKPNNEKIQLLQKAANNYRWLSAIKKNNRIIIVNIPSAQLKAYDSNTLKLSMRVIVGKTRTHTNTLSSEINRVVLNPYWNVPRSIIKKEMYPKFVADKTYFARNGYTLINKDGKPVDATTIDVNSVSQSNFPYSVRQSTGLDNSLGLLKVEFESPSAIYLHDTPNKKLFSSENRFYSHGCIRMEKPIEIGKWLLENNRVAIDTFDFKKPKKYNRPRPVPVTIPTQVIIWYNLVDFDKNGKLNYYKNIYDLNLDKLADK
jgi:murein L,D-transpeptidase YcbB/YkuD